MLWFTRAASWAAVINVLATYLSYYWPTFSSGPAQATVITLITVAITAINLRGIRQSSVVVNVLTAAKLIPLVSSSAPVFSQWTCRAWPSTSR